MYQKGNSTQELWDYFKKELEDSIDENIPQKTARIKDGNPWITRDIKRPIRKRDRLYKKQKKSGDPKHKKKYKELKRLVQKEIRRAYWKYIEDIITPDPNDDKQPNCMKRFWTFIKHKRSHGNEIPPLQNGGLLHSDPVEKANILNNQFQSAFSEKSEFTKTDFPKICNMTNTLYPTIQDLNITENGIAKLLSNLNPHKAAGPDGITSRVLKELSTDMAPILKIIFKQSYDTDDLHCTRHMEKGKSEPNI